MRQELLAEILSSKRHPQPRFGIMQQQTEIVHQNLARRRLEQPTILNEISEKDDFKTIVNSDGDSSAMKEPSHHQSANVQHTLTPT